MSDKAKTPHEARSRSFRRASHLLILGLVIQWLTLHWAHPTAFLAFTFLGTALVVLGVVGYLWTVVSSAAESS